MTRAPAGKAPAQTLRDLDPDSVLRLIGSAGDLALVLDGNGSVLDILSNDRERLKAALRDWRGRAWAELVTVESRDKVAELLRDAQVPQPSAARWRHVNHIVKGSEDLPMMYTAVCVVDDARAPTKRRLVAIGRDLRSHLALQQRLVEAQQSMERDYARLREAETRYRNLFQSTGEAVLIVDGASLKVIEANPAALALCGTRSKPIGAALTSLFDNSAAGPLQALLAAARSVGKHEPLAAVLSAGSRVTVYATQFRQEQAAFLLVRLGAPTTAAPARRGASAPAANIAASASGAMLAAFVRSAADGLVFTDGRGRIVSANQAFAGLAQLSSEEQARGEPLDRWLGRTGVEIGVLISHLRDRGTVGLYTTELRGELGAGSEVEISASQLEAGGEAQFAFAVRDIGRRLRPDERSLPKVPHSVKQLTELVGRVPLKDIVAETSELIEKLSIETALQMTRDNRALAAQMLGLSRQSLYVKLRRYGLGDLPEASND